MLCVVMLNVEAPGNCVGLTGGQSNPNQRLCSVRSRRTTIATTTTAATGNAWGYKISITTKSHCYKTFLFPLNKLGRLYLASIIISYDAFG
jgi:hypothetical protein